MPHKRTRNKTHRGHRLTVKADQPILLANGAKLRNGQIIGGEPMQKNQVQRKLNSSMPKPVIADEPNIARDSTVAKRALDAIPIKEGMKSQTRPDGVHPFAHGQALADEPLQKNWEGKGNIPLHPSTPARVAAAVHPIANDAGEILRDAARLGRPAEKA